MIEKIRKYYQNEIVRLAVGALFFIAALILDLFDVPVFSTAFYIIALLVAGAPVFISAVKGIIRRDLLDEKFLMSIASVGAMIIGDMSEGVAVMLFFLLGEIFEHKAVRKSRNSIKSLMDIRPDEATVLINGIETVMDAEDVEIGSEIIIRAGERVPIDATVISGSADVDVSMLTGESLPRSACEGDCIESGSIVFNGVLTARTERLAEQSSAQRILELVENASENKAREENFITVFSRIYTPIVVGLSVLMAIFLPLLIESIEWSDSIYRALTFLVISCPCALVISVPMAFFGGIGAAAANGILFKGGNVFSPLSRADSFVFDKTGTLTTGEIKIEKITAIGISEAELCYYAASAEYGSNHPISAGLRSLCENPTVPEKTMEIAGKGIAATVDKKEVLVGNEALMSEYGVELPDEIENAIIVAIDGSACGFLKTGDSIKREAAEAISILKKSGVKDTFILSGDKSEKVSEVALNVGINNVFTDLLPEDKYAKLQEIINSSTKTCFVGDGINDAPSLALSDVGIAMGNLGSDSAIEAADVVIINDDLKKIPLARRIARRTILIAKQNIAFALGIKLLILALSAAGYANMWLAVFADVGVAVLAILNSMRALRIKK